MFDDLSVGGYAYNSLTWEVVAPIKVERGPRGYHLPGQLWASGVAAAVVAPAGAVNEEWAYAVLVDRSPEAVAESLAWVLASRSGKGEEEEVTPLGVARIRRFRGDSPDPEPGEHRVALEGLDEVHLVDRLTTAILTWHAELHGKGPLPETHPA